ncbi:DUF3857 domain-containing protein [Sphingobacterium sp. LRF_L2]|uniref:DUF3857 domain-containing protein n=1 Tax=Sphingobacterium sp. LRF_L2 TaxID=3369421 RepID=UPI003F5E4FBE
MKHVFLLFLVSLAVFGRAQSNYNVQLIPKELKSRAAATVRNEFVTIEMRSVDEVVQKVKTAITVYNQNGDHYAYVPLYYDKASIIKSAKGIIYNEFGLPINKFGIKDFTDISTADGYSMFNDTRLKYYKHNSTQYPYTIEYEYEILRKYNLFIPGWHPNFSSAVSVEQSSYTFVSPKDITVRTYVKNVDAEPVINQTEKTISRQWEVKNIAAIKEENFTKHFRQTQAIEIDIVPTNISYYGRTGTFSSWEECGKWVYDNLLQGKQNLGDPVRQKVAELTKNCSDDKEKAKVLYKYLQEKTRYISIQVGIGGLMPFPASDVDKYGYGDCKALVNYMQNLLSFAEIPSYYCIVEAGRQKQDLRTEFANVQDGNHIILCIPFENDTTWLECTSQEQPFGFLGDFTDDRLVLACTPEGGKVLRTPTYTEQENKQLRTAKLKFINETDLQGEIVTKFFGSQYDNHFDVMHAKNSEKPKALVSHYDINNISFSNILYNKYEENSAPYVQEDLAIDIRNIAVKTNNKLTLPSSLFNSYGSIQRNDNRTQEVYINRGFTDEDLVEIELPEKVSKKILPIKKEFNCEIGSYVFTANIEDNKLVCNRILTIKQGTYPPELYASFQDFLKSVSQTDKGRFTLEILP